MARSTGHSATVTFDTEVIKTRLKRAKLAAAPAALAYSQKKAAEIENYMKANAPWTDRTGNARRGLRAEVSQSRGRYVTTIKMSYNVYYGVYLEYAMGRRYAIIEPTQRVKGPEYVNGLEGMLGNVMTSWKI